MELIAGFLFLIVGGVVVHFMHKSKQKERLEIRSSVFLERMQQVCKLVLAEGNFSQIYDTNNNKSKLFGLLPQSKRRYSLLRQKPLLGLIYKK
jgi:hypothetical protein